MIDLSPSVPVEVPSAFFPAAQNRYMAWKNFVAPYQHVGRYQLFASMLANGVADISDIRAAVWAKMAKGPEPMPDALLDKCISRQIWRYRYRRGREKWEKSLERVYLAMEFKYP